MIGAPNRRAIPFLGRAMRSSPEGQSPPRVCQNPKPAIGDRQQSEGLKYRLASVRRARYHHRRTTWNTPPRMASSWGIPVLNLLTAALRRCLEECSERYLAPPPLSSPTSEQTISSRLVLLNGLPKTASAFDAISLAFGLALSTRIGTQAVRLFDRRRRTNCSPSKTGIIRSVMTRSGNEACIWANADHPWGASLTS